MLVTQFQISYQSSTAVGKNAVAKINLTMSNAGQPLTRELTAVEL